MLGSPKLSAFLLGLLALPAFSEAQYEYLANVNYPNLGINRLANIPGVTWTTVDNTAYDQNNQRLFFRGSANQTGPYSLYTLDATTGSVLMSALCPPGGAGSALFNMQYDNGTNTLYGLYSTGAGNFYFCTIDPASGSVQTETALPPLAGSLESTFDQQDHWYISSDGHELLVIDASSGSIVYQSTVQAAVGLTDLVYDNTNRTLYALTYPFSYTAQPYTQFDSITLATGVTHPIANLPEYVFPQLYTYAIDEAQQKFIFVGAEQNFTLCVADSLYVMDLRNGNILSRQFDPYIDPSPLTRANLIEFSFDQQRGKLFALNWTPPGGNGVSVAISPLTPTVCAGVALTLSAGVIGGSGTETFQWQVNGIDAGPDDSSFVYNQPGNGDTVRCILRDSLNCVVVVEDTSNAMVLSVDNTPAASVNIAASASSVCAGDTVAFDAIAVNGGSAPAFIWQVNGTPVDSGSSVFRSEALQNGDQVDCVMTGSQPCSVPVNAAAPVVMTINPLPVVRAGDDTVILPGGSVPLNASVSGGVVSTYQWEPTSGLSDPTAPATMATPASTTEYRLTAVTDQGCIGSDSLTISIGAPLRMPGAFTPNGDGINDVFRIPASAPQAVIRFSVYDRWGAMVFTTNASSGGWDGTTGGKVQPAGTYIWEMEYLDPFTRKPERAEGTVVLMR